MQISSVNIRTIIAALMSDISGSGSCLLLWRLHKPGPVTRSIRFVLVVPAASESIWANVCYIPCRTVKTDFQYKTQMQAGLIRISAGAGGSRMAHLHYTCSNSQKSCRGLMEQNCTDLCTTVNVTGNETSPYLCANKQS